MPASRAHAVTLSVPGAAILHGASRLLIGAAFLVTYVLLEWVSFIH
jgi:hypothetical protein